MDNSPLLSVIIPSHLPSEPLHELTRYLRTQAPFAEIIIVKNGPESFPVNIEGARSFHIEQSGPSTARNLGAKEAKGKYLLFLDADAYPRDGALQRLVQLLLSAPSWMKVIQLQIIPVQGQENFWRARFEIARRRTETKGTFNTCILPFSFPLLDSCGLVFRRDAFIQLGGFDPRLKRMEDRFLGMCCLREGLVLWPCLDVAIEKRLHTRTLQQRLQARWHESLGLQCADELFGERRSSWQRLLMYWKTIPAPASEPHIFFLMTLALLEEKLSAPLLAFVRKAFFKKPASSFHPTSRSSHWQNWRLHTERFSFFFYFKDQLRVRDMHGVWCSDLSEEETRFLLQTFFSDEKKATQDSFMQIALIKRGMAQGWLTRLSSPLVS